MSWRLALGTSAAILCLLCACASRPPASQSATLASTSAQRGAVAFARGDLETAQREYKTALYIHESLDDLPGRAAALLSLSRIASQAGRPADALAAVNQVLADKAFLSPALRVTALGRAAALQLGQGAAQQADQLLAEADMVCAGSCADVAALTVLRARSAMAQQQPAAALRFANTALAMGNLAASNPPTLRPQANAERANALRVQAEARLASGQPQSALGALTEALDLDRALGLPDRVLLDLQLLSRAHQALGAGDVAQHYRVLANRAQVAGKALRGDAQAD